MTKAMVLCAGLGTRLRPLTNELPKPLVWLGDRPMLAHVIDRLAAGGIERVVVNTHHLPERFDRALLDSLSLDVQTVHEPVIAGTAGGVACASDALGPGDVVTWNGDILADVDIAALQRDHAQQAARGALATLVVLPRSHVGEGTVGIGEDGRVVRLRGQVFGVEVRSADYVGVQMIGASLRNRLPSNGCFVADVYLPAMRQGDIIATTPVVSRFSDLGTVDVYLEENLRWLRDRSVAAYLGPGAVVDEGIDVDGSIVGAGAIVRGHGVLKDVVVWPGATVTAPLQRAVVMSDGQIVHV